MRTIKYNHTDKNLIIKPQQVIQLAKLCYEPWKREYLLAEKSWKSTKLPDLERKIDEHNKEVQQKKSVYSFNTYLPIGEADKQAIIDKEKNFYIYTSQRVYEFNSKFEINYSDRSTIESEPDFLDDVDWSKVVHTSFEVRTKYGKKSTSVEIGLTNNYQLGIKYEVSGTDQWVKSIKTDIEEILSKGNKPHHITYHKGKIALFIAILLTYTIYSILTKVLQSFWMNIYIDVSAPIVRWVTMVLIFIFSMRWINIHLEDSFPNFSVQEKYSPFETGTIKYLAGIILAIFANGVYDLFKLAFLKK